MEKTSDLSSLQNSYSITAQDDQDGENGFVIINEFKNGPNRWQAQVLTTDGLLWDADYFDTEVIAIRWALAEFINMTGKTSNK